MSSTEIAVGSKVTILPSAPMFAYFPEMNGYATGTVTKIYKNGQALVAIDQIKRGVHPRFSKTSDGLLTKQIGLADLAAN